MNEMTQSNKQGWDGLAEAHYRNYHVEKLIQGTPLLNELVRREVGDVQGKSLIHLLCHIGTDTLSWALLGADVTGVDISSESLKYARRIARNLEIEAKFVEADIMQTKETVQTTFDIVFASTGVLCWIPDIQRFAHTVRHLLHEEGFFYLFDGHPMRDLFDDEPDAAGSPSVPEDYFRKEVWQFDNMGDYTDPTLSIPVESYEWHWTMGDIITSFCDAGLRIEFLHEFPQYFYSGYTAYDVEDDKVELYPCTFSLKATVG